MSSLSTFIYSSSNDYWLWSVAGLCAGAFLFYRGFHLLQRRRLILDTPASKIRSASIGLVEISGLAVGPYTMPAPLTGAPCYYYRTVAWQLKQSGKNKEWKKVADESLHLPFYLDDNSGRVLIDPQGAELDLHRDFQEEFDIALFSSRFNLPPNVAGFLARHGIGNDKKLKLEEYCIKPKNALFVLGTLAPNPGLEVSATPVPTISDDSVRFQFRMNLPSISMTGTEDSIPVPADAGRSAAVEVIRLPGADRPSNLTGMTQQEKVAAALTKAGIMNPAAWAAAGAQYPDVKVSSTETPTSNAALAAPEFDPKPASVLMKGTNNPAFFVSWRSQHEVAQSLGWQSTLMIWGGPALILISLFILLSHFGWM